MDIGGAEPKNTIFEKKKKLLSNHIRPSKYFITQLFKQLKHEFPSEPEAQTPNS